MHWGVVLAIGILVGGAIAIAIFYGFVVGTLKVVPHESGDQPYMFLELSKDVDFVTQSVYVVMKVDAHNYTSRK